ncbi:cation diffusion facilitator family transporter [Marinilactibacillus piezotolerans]|uniref:Cation diffusion facilitator family transporter n=1 Tax=Marinilactibacillus piezotolerans TaxID=258723 RepID=A0A1I4ALC2_9LACT|nr:cation diffusion facilitator family transporter [Marinilactibacillus piezotolerans]SFK57312.1 cation diffusion facilitator family transporter [Marinilactibacillus piezotolerans]
MENRYERIQSAERGARISIVVYVLLALMKLIVGYGFNSTSLSADGLNNLTDVISSVTILIGLRAARKPADSNHPYGHWKAEPIASLITSFAMLFVGFQVLQSTINRLISGDVVPPNRLAAIAAIIGAIVMLCVYRYNLNLSKRVQSNGLAAVAKDNLADALTSLATAIAIFASALGWGWIDGVMAVIVSLIILKTGVEVFRESTFSLSDGFHETELEEYHAAVVELPQVREIASLKARMYGTNIYADITILVDSEMTVQEGHDITEKIEELLYENFDVMHTDVHVEPYHLKKNIFKKLSN